MITVLLIGVALAATAPAQLSPDLNDPRVRVASQKAVLQGLLDAGLGEDALRALASMREAGEDLSPFTVLQARALHLNRMPDEALGLLDAYLRTHARDGAAWALKGVVLADLDRPAEAVRALQRANRLTPEDAGVLNNLGYASLAAGEAEAAVRHLRAALQLDPLSTRARNNLGFAYARLDRDAEALTAFRAGSPNESDARYNLGVACELRGDRGSAITQYQAAVAARPDHPQAGDALARRLSEEPS